MGCALEKGSVVVEATDVNKCKTVKSRAHCPSTGFTPGSNSRSSNPHRNEINLRIFVKIKSYRMRLRHCPKGDYRGMALQSLTAFIFVLFEG